MKANYFDYLDKEKDLWGNCACSLHINPFTCGREQQDCDGCKNFVKEYYDQILKERLLRHDKN